ncbi:cyclic peptide export ABC transporter [Paenibacillus sp. UMB4589-SE434]|uniref:cyclic peptide export ABC transporter n=1 Tax=Paenibacillus sp. UMB4589-SE434 TaxID=3046314 RepID=UPI00255186A0|nr:cyclic peptide export ABC transporter [Paenibacillus sp. UMB4589-SE434]MDK8179803.1 cyclic peptide export ABC transporter [Paenibacillus sp. UMB4589-SE434]
MNDNLRRSGVRKVMSLLLASLLMPIPISYASADFYEPRLLQAAWLVKTVTVIMMVAGLYMLFRNVVDYIRWRRNEVDKESIRGRWWWIVITGCIWIGASTILIPYYGSVTNNNWSQFVVTLPTQVAEAVGWCAAAITVFIANSFFSSTRPTPHLKTYLPLILLSITSGLTNSLIIFIVNQAVVVEASAKQALFLCFGLALASYFLAQRIVRALMIRLTNRIVYERRTRMLAQLARTRYQQFEQISREKILTSLNNDVEVVSNFANLIVTVSTSMMIILFGFVYLGWLDMYGFLFSLGVVVLSSLLYFAVGQRANRLWEETRDLQNVFFRFVQELVSGFRELSLHRGKKHQFEQELTASCQAYSDKRTTSGLMYAKVILTGELMFMLVIGSVVFVFPLLFPGGSDEVLRDYVFIFLYMTGHVSFVLNTIPEFMHFRVSWRRLRLLEASITELEESDDAGEVVRGNYTLELEGVRFSYPSQQAEPFAVGPFNCTFNSGEITFITGGNGSGKSTLAKLILGLYAPDEGRVVMNGQAITPDELSQSFSAVFSDFHLFDRLYGLDKGWVAERLPEYIRLLGLEGKVTLEADRFSTTLLSTGQRKRLALLICLLEDRPFCLLDEWAADQDPEYRQFFYEVLLPDMKQHGTCVICITHDDRYFDHADQLIKLEHGLITSRTGNVRDKRVEYSL